MIRVSALHSLPAILCLALLLTLASCELPKAEVATQEEVAKASAKLHHLLLQYDSLWMANDALYATRHGSRVGYTHLGPFDDAHLQTEMGILTAWRERLAREIDTTQLDKVAAQDYKLFLAYADQRQASYRLRRFAFPPDALPFPGTHAFFLRVHPLETSADAEAYLSRLQLLPSLLRDWQTALIRRETDSLLPPDFVLRQIRQNAIQSAGILTPDSHLVADPAHPWLARLSQFAATRPELAGQRDALARKAWETYAYQAIPEYNKLLKWFYTQEAQADSFVVVSDYASGVEWYNHLLTHYAGAPTTGEDAYTLGIARTEKLSLELAQLIASERFPGGVKQYLDSLRRAREGYLFVPSPQGKQDFANAVRKMQDSLARKAPELVDSVGAFPLTFGVAETVVGIWQSPWKRSEEGRDTAHLVLDLGGRDRLESWRWRAALAREALPGKALPQYFMRSIRDSLPPFRRELEAPWLVEGWSIYSLRLPMELGWYADTAWYRSVLIEEMIASALLVVDAGLHSSEWRPAHAELYLRDNTPLSDAEIRQLICEVQARPGAAIAPIAGCERIRAWRAQVSKALGARFKLSTFHHQLLRQGAVPVAMLQAEIDALLKQTTSPQPTP